MSTKDYTSVLKMAKLEFEKIEFKRTGSRNSNEVKYSFNVSIGENERKDYYKVILGVVGTKMKEYDVSIELAGYFEFEAGSQIKDEEKRLLVQQNAVAIMMPYVRSELSLLTAQPNTDTLVLPPFNIIEMMKNAKTVNE